MRCLPRSTSALVVLLVATAVTGTAHAFDPITWYSIDSGGAAFATGGSYRLGGTIGQPDAGRLTGGAFELRGGFWFGGQAPATGVDDDGAAPALVFRLFRGPNPVRSQARVAFELPSSERVHFSIFDVTGRVAKKVDFGLLPAGRQERSWSANDETGRPLPTGVYYLRLEAGSHQAIQKVLILR